MAAGTARLLLLAALALAIGACAGRADAAYEYRGTWFGEPEDALAHIRDGEGCRTDRFWAATAGGRWTPWFETDIAAANDLFRETLVPFPPDNVPLNGDILAWCGGQPPAAATPTRPPPPVPTPVTEIGDPPSAFSDAELDNLTLGPQWMHSLPIPFCTIQEGRPSGIGAEDFRNWVRGAERAWDDAAGQDAIEYLGDCSTRNTIRFADLGSDRHGEAQLTLLADGPRVVIRIASEAPSSNIFGILIHEMGHALTLEHAAMRQSASETFPNARAASILRAAIARAQSTR